MTHAQPMNRPRILITTATSFRSSGLRRLDSVTGLNYAQAVVQAGGLPLMVPNVAAELAAAYLDGADGLLLSGGSDVDPALFGQVPHPQLGKVDPERDALELALYRHARERGLPVLGICRGLQVINVAAGGTLHQHLPAVPNTIQHEQRDISGTPLHPVTLEPDTLLMGAYGTPRLAVNSFHHQAIDLLGNGLRVVARSDDGIIEAAESDDGLVIGVQWHPEMSFHRFPEQFPPFALFLDLVRRHARVGAV